MEGSGRLVATAVYQPEPLAAAAARRFIRDTLQSWVVTGAGAEADGNGLVDDAVLLTSELVTNAVVHAGTPVHVTCRLAEGNVEVVVRDSQPASIVPEPSDDGSSATERTSGRGLLLPSALASTWGVTYGRAAKAVWFRIGLGSPGAVPDETGDSDPAGPAALTAALRQALATPAPPPPAGAGDGHGRPPGDPGYQELLQHTVESARAAAAADAACALLAGEDGELRLRAATGTVPVGGPPAVVTVPFVVDGRITGLLAATRTRPESFRESETARLQELADRIGPALERARLGELDRVRRERISALAIARDLLAGDLGQDKVMALAAEAVVPRLAEWCAVLLASPDGRLRPACVRHLDESLEPALASLLDRMGTSAGIPGWRSQPGEAGPRADWRWPLAGAAGDDPGAPPGTTGLAGDVACCFPFPGAGDGLGVLVVGCPQSDPLPRDATALVADLACRLGVALVSAPLSGRSQ